MTERDIVKSIAKGVQPDGITADSLMSSHILSIRMDQPIEKGSSSNDKKQSEASSGGGSAARNGVIGIITATDVARYLQKRMKQTTADREVEKDPQTASSSSEELLLSEAWELYF